MAEKEGGTQSCFSFSSLSFSGLTLSEHRLKVGCVQLPLCILLSSSFPPADSARPSVPAADTSAPSSCCICFPFPSGPFFPTFFPSFFPTFFPSFFPTFFPSFFPTFFPSFFATFFLCYFLPLLLSSLATSFPLKTSFAHSIVPAFPCHEALNVLNSMVGFLSWKG